MSIEISLYQVDAFTSAVFAGNPAAVCPLERWLPTVQMQAIAAENNLSETAFFVPRGQSRDDGFDLRWFTPIKEVDLCGHATLASAFVISTYLQPRRDHLRFQCQVGALEVSRDGDLFTLDFPARPPQPFADKALVEAALGCRIEETHKATKMMAVAHSQTVVAAVKPDLARVADLPSDGLIITAPGDDCDFVSRYFAPHAGIAEDPVTGSAHCVLTPYWARRLGKDKMRCRQISARGGELLVENQGVRVLISGHVAPYLVGTIRV